MGKIQGLHILRAVVLTVAVYGVHAHSSDMCVGLKTLMDSGQICSDQNSAANNRLIKESHEKCQQEYESGLNAFRQAQSSSSKCAMPDSNIIQSSNILQRSLGLNLSCLDERHRPAPFASADESCSDNYGLLGTNVGLTPVANSRSTNSGSNPSGGSDSNEEESRRGGPWLNPTSLDPSSVLTRGSALGRRTGLRNNSSSNSISGGIDWANLEKLNSEGRLRSAGASNTVGNSDFASNTDTRLLLFAGALNQLNPESILGKASLLQALRDRNDLFKEYDISSMRSREAKSTMLEITRMLKAEEELLGGPSGHFIQEMRYKVAVLDAELFRTLKLHNYADTTYLTALAHRMLILSQRGLLKTSDMTALSQQSVSVSNAVSKTVASEGRAPAANSSPTSGNRREVAAYKNSLESRAANNINLVTAIPAYKNAIQTLQANGNLSATKGTEALAKVNAIEARALTTQNYGRGGSNTRVIQRNLSSSQKWEIVKDLERVYYKYLSAQGQML